MCLLANFGDHRCNRNGYANPYIISYMNILGEDELKASVHHIERFFKSGIPVYNSESGKGVKKKVKKKGNYKALCYISKHNLLQAFTVFLC